MKTKLLTTLTAALIALSAWANGVEIDGIYYLLYTNTKTASVTFIGNSENSAYYDKTYSYKGDITIPSSVTYGGTTYSVTGIGASTFADCSSLTSVTIPASVTNVVKESFVRCSGLKSIIVETENTKYDSRDNCNAIIETATNTLIAGCKNTFIPNSVIAIGKSAFYGCTGLKSILIPNSVTSIGEQAFADCNSLTSIEIPNSVTSIGNRAFWWCLGLTTVTMGNSVKIIGNEVFWNCNRLTSIKLPNSVTTIGKNAFAICKALTNIEIPNSVTTIGEGAFSQCKSLTSIILSNSIKTIERSVFSYCSSLISINIPNSVKSIEYQAFYGTSLMSIEIPNSVTFIGNGAFEDCYGLTSIEFPHCVIKIEDQAFRNCKGLGYIYVQRSDPGAYLCSTSAFSGVPFSTCTLHVPSGSKEAYANIAPWSYFKNIVEEDLTSIEPLTLTPSEAGQTYYNLQGQRITNPQRGQLVIVRYADGTSRKVVVK